MRFSTSGAMSEGVWVLCVGGVEPGGAAMLCLCGVHGQAKPWSIAPCCPAIPYIHGTTTSKQVTNWQTNGRTVGRADARGHVLLVVLKARKAEVDDLELRVGRLRLEQEVLGLEVPVVVDR
jgi:hypothetical protein